MTTLQANYGSIATVESNTNHLVSKKAEAGAECCICFTKFNEEEICIGHTVSNVDHVFHKECLKGWWDQGKRSCPVCRAHLTDSENRLNTDPENGLNTDPENGLNTDPENRLNTDPENGLNTDPENRLISPQRRCTSSQRCCVGVVLSILVGLGVVLAITMTFGYISSLQQVF